jgi:DNA-binding transcriptional LysR family regulator
MSLKIDDLLLLAEVHSAGSLSAAARTLALPKATLSRRLTALEAAVGTRVFVPDARRLKLTDFGNELALRAARHRDEVETTRQWIGAADPRPRGRLRLSVNADFAVLLMAEAMVSFVARYPEVTMDVDTTPPHAQNSAQSFDLAVRIGPIEDSNLVARRLMTLQRGLYASPRYLALHGAPRVPADLAQHKFVVLNQAAAYPYRLHRRKRSMLVTFNGALSCNSMGLVRALTVAGGGLGSFSHGMVRGDVTSGQLVPVLPDWEFDPVPVSLLMAGGKLMPAKVRVFVDHLLEVMPNWGS